MTKTKFLLIYIFKKIEKAKNLKSKVTRSVHFSMRYIYCNSYTFEKVTTLQPF